MISTIQIAISASDENDNATAFSVWAKIEVASPEAAANAVADALARVLRHQHVHVLEHGVTPY